MALATQVLKTNLYSKIKEILDTSFDEKSDSEAVKDNFAKNLADVIGSELETWIKTATVTVAPGIPVATAGTPVSQTGATTGTGQGTIS